MIVKRFLLVAAAAVLAANGASRGANPAGRFEIKLSSEQRIRQVLNRLTFGARPGDIEDVRKQGIEKWIELQLHPERIPESPALEIKLKPLETLRMQPEEVLKQYMQQPPPGFIRPVNLNSLLPGQQFRKVFNGTAEERRAALMALDAGKRMQVLSMVPANVLEGLPDLQKEQEAARQKQQEQRQMEMRRLRPPLGDLLDAQQREIALHGSAERRASLYRSLDPEALRKVAAALPPNALAGQPELRRTGEWRAARSRW